jgi:phosphinothricin acetyltransferase
MLIRPADPERDAAACAEIYAPFVTDTAVSFEEQPPTAEELAARMHRVTRTHAWFVADDGTQAVGFAYSGPHRQRAAYRWATDVSVYVHGDYRGKGVGRALYGELLPALARQGLWVACGGVTLPNEASVALHEACGFELVGVYRRIGWKAGAWRDVAWYQADLSELSPHLERGELPPPEPSAPA